MREGESLRADLVLDRQPSPGERERFPVTLQAGDFLEVVDLQDGVDTVLSFFDSKGERQLRCDSPTGTRESEEILVVVRQAGTYTLEVEASKAEPGGSHHLRVVAWRPATGRDRERSAAFELFARAEELRRQRTDPARREAVTLYWEAAARWRALGETRREATSLLRLNSVLSALDEIAEAVKACRQAIPLFERLQDRRRLAEVLAKLGKHLDRSGALDESYQASRRALALEQELQDATREADLWVDLGRLFQKQGRFGSAEACYEEALTRYEQLRWPLFAATTWGNLAYLYLQAGNVDLARLAVTKASAVLPADAPLEDKAFLVETEGAVFRATNQPSQAHESFQRAVDLYGQAGQEEKAWSAVQGLAHLAFARGDFASAARLTNVQIGLLDRAADATNHLLALQNLGQIELRRGNPGAAGRAFLRVVAEARQKNLRSILAAALLGLARLERRAGRLDHAETFLREALDLLEQLRASAQRRNLQTSLFSSIQDFFDEAVEILVRRAEATGDDRFVREAFAISERSRARWLLDEVSAPEGGKEDSEEGLGSRTRLREQVRDAERRRQRLIEAGAAPPEIKSVERELREAAVRLARARTLRLPARLDIEERAPAAGEPALASLAEVQQGQLDARTLLLEYDLGAERSFLFAATRERVQVFSLPPAAVIEAAAREAHPIFARSARMDAGQRPQQAARVLGAMLLGPVAPFLQGQRLLVVPDGVLHTVPFGALEIPTNSKPGVRLLLADHELVLAPSASTAVALARRGGGRGHLRKGIALFADPVFTTDDPRFLAPGQPGPIPEPVAADLESLERDVGGALRRLRFAAAEAAAIEGIAPAGSVLDASGFQATKDRLLAMRLDRFAILHFATHGLLNPQEPELSGLVLSLFDEHGQAIDGVLRAHEIERLPLAAKLVVLSACRTAQGREVRGEGVVSLSHAFFRAGASQVVVSLWPVDDAATAELMGRFYRGLYAESLGPGEALRRAQLAVRAIPKWRAPYYWSGFVLQGHG